MNRAQRVAWLFVITISLAVISSLVAFVVLYVIGMPKVAVISSAFLAIAGFAVFVPIVFPKDKGKITRDERDTFIYRQAAIAGFVTAFSVVGLACMLPFLILASVVTAQQATS